MELPKTADAVVVGGGTVGAWCAYFLRKAGLGTVALVEKGTLGQGASSRAAGVVRVQGGTPEAVRLGQWSRAFYLGQRDEIGTDSGFTQQGYLLPAFSEPEVAAAHARIEMQQALGLPARWLAADEVDAINLALMRSKLAALVPLTAGLGIRRAWAATIDFTPDHLPIIGAAPGYASVFVASAGGAGMMWGPAVGRAVADVALTVTPDGGKPTTLGPGDVAVFPRGWRGPWDLHEAVRKVYVVF